MAISKEDLEVKAEESFLGTPDLYEKFIRSNVIWKDIVSILDRTKEECLKALTDPEVVNNMESLADYQSRVYMLDFFKTLPETILQVIKASKFEEEVEQNG